MDLPGRPGLKSAVRHDRCTGPSFSLSSVSHRFPKCWGHDFARASPAQGRPAFSRSGLSSRERAAPRRTPATSRCFSTCIATVRRPTCRSPDSPPQTGGICKARRSSFFPRRFPQCPDRDQPPLGFPAYHSFHGNESGYGAACRKTRSRDLLQLLLDEGGDLIEFPLAEEYTTLIRFVGPMAGYLAALQFVAQFPGLPGLMPTSAQILPLARSSPPADRCLMRC
jgi:hypothetical protein